jgi:cation-transporting ATPase 13A1
VKDCGPQTILCLAAAHALVRLDDGTVVGDPMEKTTLEALDWKIAKGAEYISPKYYPHSFVHAAIGDVISGAISATHRTQIVVRRRFQFSSSLKRMSTVSSLPDGKTLVAVKGAPEAIKLMLGMIPEGYDEIYKHFTRRGSRVLALGSKTLGSLSVEKVRVALRYHLRWSTHFFL